MENTAQNQKHIAAGMAVVVKIYMANNNVYVKVGKAYARTPRLMENYYSMSEELERHIRKLIGDNVTTANGKAVAFGEIETYTDGGQKMYKASRDNSNSVLFSISAMDME